MALLDAVNEIIAEIQTISGIRRVPEQPPENNDQFPFAIVYPGTGSYHQAPAVVMTGLHNVTIELHVSRKDLPRDYSTVMNLIDKIPEELMKLHNAGGFSDLATFGDIEYSFGSMIWAGVDTLGVRYTMTDVKVQTNLV